MTAAEWCIMMLGFVGLVASAIIIGVESKPFSRLANWWRRG